MKSVISIHEQVRVDCIEAIVLHNLREMIETLNPGYCHRLMWVDRDGQAHATIWDPSEMNFTEIHLYNDWRHPIPFNYINKKI